MTKKILIMEDEKILQDFLKNGYLHFQLIDGITKKDDFLNFVINIHSRKPFQASFASSSRESCCKNSCLDDECNCCVNNIGVFGHSFCFWSLIRKKKSV